MVPFDPASIVLATLLLSLVLFLTDKVRYDLIALGVVVVLAGSGVLSPEQAFAGFASPAVMMIAAMYVFGAAMTRWGVAELIGQRLLTARTGGEAALVFRVVLVSGLLSSVLSNAGVVAILIPVLSSVARKQGLPVSRLMMPLGFGALLGGMVTLIGTSKNLAVNAMLRELGHEPFGLFEFSHFGLVLLSVGALYFLGPGRWLLPKGRKDVSLAEQYQVPKFVTEILVNPGSTLINRSVADTDLFTRFRVSVIGIVREGGDQILAPGPYNRIRQEDSLILQGEPEDLVRLRREVGVRLRDSVQVGETQLRSGDVHLVEALVPSGSPLVGRSLADTEFHATTSLNVLAICKQGEVQTKRMSRYPLAVGDTLLVQGHERDLERARARRDILVMGELDLKPMGRGGLFSLLILGAVLLSVGLNLLPISVAAVAGALGLVVTGCLPTRAIYKAIDWPALVLIGGMISLGVAFEETGLAEGMAQGMGAVGEALSHPILLLASLMAVTVVLTQVTSHIASAVIMTPVAIFLAQQAGIDERAMLMAVLTGAELGFMTPVAHQANAMIMGPGEYRYRDFLRVGTPLTIILVIVTVVVLPVFWPL
ncbi:MAG: SLC13 family permease [Planctomycetota bacterium]|jgi:di/tricarboxylate transporter|nr:SLC13 family permease [Planctomycetota bacterium]MDP6955965.1 SLC13 family permease [Planctomycetota bacterium]